MLHVTPGKKKLPGCCVPPVWYTNTSVCTEPQHEQFVTRPLPFREIACDFTRTLFNDTRSSKPMCRGGVRCPAFRKQPKSTDQQNVLSYCKIYGMDLRVRGRSRAIHFVRSTRSYLGAHEPPQLSPVTPKHARVLRRVVACCGNRLCAEVREKRSCRK